MKTPSCEPVFTGKGRLKRQKIYSILNNNQPLTTRQILDQYNNTSRKGMSINEIGNIMAKTKQFKKLYFVNRKGEILLSNENRKALSVWGLNE